MTKLGADDRCRRLCDNKNAIGITGFLGYSWEIFEGIPIGMGEKAKRNPTRYLIWVLPASALLHLFFYLTIPLLDNDSIVIFQGAREFAAGGALSKVNTLPILLTGISYRFFTENILIARAPQLIAGIGLLILLWRLGSKIGPIAAIVAVVLFGTIPSTLLYGAIAKTYMLMVFLIFSGAIFYYNATADNRKSGLRFLYSVAAASCFWLAFLCYTFAATALVPVVVILIATLLQKRYRHLALPSLTTGAIFGLFLALTIAWRWKQFGFGVLNDYAIDWRFAASSAIWSGRWVGLTDIWGTGIAFLVPGVLVLAHRRGWLKPFGILGTYGAIFVCVNVALYLLNPVNHFPRVLLASLPFLCLFIGSATERMIAEGKHSIVFIAWIITAATALLVFYPPLRPGHAPLWVLDPHQGKGILMTVLAISLIFMILLAMLRPAEKAVRALTLPLVAVLLLGSTATGIAMTRHYSMEQARIFQSRAQLVKTVSVRGLLGGGDYQNLAYAGTDTVAWMIDFNPEELEVIFGGGLIEVLKHRGISHAIISRDDPEGFHAMMAGLALEKGLDIRDMGRVFYPLYNIRRASRIADNDYGAVYFLKSVPIHRLSPEQVQRLNDYHTSCEALPPMTLLRFADAKGNPFIGEQPLPAKVILDAKPEDVGMFLTIRAFAPGSLFAGNDAVIHKQPVTSSHTEIELSSGRYQGEQLLVSLEDETGKAYRQISILHPDALPAFEEKTP